MTVAEPGTKFCRDTDADDEHRPAMSWPYLLSQARPTARTISILILAYGRLISAACKSLFTGSRAWTDYDGTSVVSKVWGERASLFELEASGPAGHIEGVGIAALQSTVASMEPELANSADPVMTTPMIGSLSTTGQFYDQEEFQEESAWSAMDFPPLPKTRAILNRRSLTTLARRGRQTGS